MKIAENGGSHTGKQNYRCCSCGKQFQFHYQNAGRRPDTKRLVLHMLVRNCGV